mgnify:CR=1 FL=1
MLLCAQYILPITSEPFQNGAVLVRDGRICDIGTIIGSHAGPGTVAVFIFGDERAPE